MRPEIDDFTIALPELTDMGVCDLKVYKDLDRLWRMVEKYKMTAPIKIRVADNRARYVRAMDGTYNQATGWQLKDETLAFAQSLRGEAQFPLTMRVQDGRGNILKMRLQVEVANRSYPKENRS
jgi:hypothetical protein